MLEREYGEPSVRYSLSFLEGYIEGALMSERYMRRVLRKYKKDYITEKIESYDDVRDEEEDLQYFLEKYRTKSPKDVASHILKESEYLHSPSL